MMTDNGSVYSVKLDQKDISVLSTAVKLGAVDGVAQKNDVIFASSNQTGELFAFTDRERILLGSFKAGIADIGVFEDRLYAPFLLNNTIIAFDIDLSN